MKLFTILIIMTVFIIKIHSLTYTYQATDGYECNEPEPTGGKLCTENSECNGKAKSICDYINKCDLSNKINATTKSSTGLKNITVGKCVCAKDYAMEDCSHERYNKDLAGGLQFLCFVGVGGVGNFVANRIISAVLQLIMMLSVIIIITIIFCCNYEHFERYILVHGLYKIDNTYLKLILLCMMVGCIWCIVDAVRFIGGYLVDDSGYYPYNTDCTFIKG
jgi:hypothetical protein